MTGAGDYISLAGEGGGSTAELIPYIRYVPCWDGICFLVVFFGKSAISRLDRFLL